MNLELKSGRDNSYANIVLLIACVENTISDVDFTSRYKWEFRHILEPGDCHQVTRELSF